MSERAPGNHVTDILDVMGMYRNDDNIPKGQVDFYLRRGSAVHSATAMFDRGTLDESSVDPLIAPYLEAWKAFRREVGGDMLHIELFMASDVLDYCGTLDRIVGPSLIYPGKLLLDIKTSEAAVTTRLQTCGYLKLCEFLRLYEPGELKRGAVALKSNGRYAVELYDDDARDMAAWQACMTLAAWKRKQGV